MREITTSLVSLFFCVFILGGGTGVSQVTKPLKAQIDVDTVLVQLARTGSGKELDAALNQHPDWVRIDIAKRAFEKSQESLPVDTKASLAYGRIVTALASRLNDKPLRIRSLFLLAKLETSEGSFDEALSKYDECYRLSKELNESSYAFATRILSSLARSNMLMVDDAKRDAEQALEIAQAAKDDHLTAIAHLISGTLAQDRLDNLSALKSFAYARNLLERSPQSKFELTSAHTLLPEVFSRRAVLLQMLLHNIGLMYATQGDFDNAVDYFRQSLTYGPETKLCGLTSITYSTIGYLYQYQDNVIKGEESFGSAQSALQGCRAPRTDEALALVRNGQAMVALAKGDPHKALDLANSSLNLSLQLRLSDQITDAQNTLGRAHLKLGHYQEAIDYAQAAVKISGKTFNYRRVWESYLTLAEAQEALGRVSEAEENLQRALDVSEQARLNLVGGEQERQFFMSQNVIPYHAAIKFMIRHNRATDAYRLAEKAKSRTLLEALSGSKSGFDEFLSPSEKVREVALKRDIQRANTQLFVEGNRDKPDESKIELLKMGANEKRQVYENFLNEVYATHPGLRVRQGDIREIDFGTVGALLRKHSFVAMHYVITADSVLLFVVKEQGTEQPNVNAYTLTITPQELTRQVIGFQTALVNRKANFDIWGRKLYDGLIRPVQKEIEGHGTICVIPDGILWKLPFAALQDDDEYLVRKHAVFFAPSLAALEAMAQETPQSRQELLALANPSLPDNKPSRNQGFVTRSVDLLRGKKLVPLPETETEARTIARMYGSDRSKVLVGRNAREASFKSLAGSYNVIHLAAHGFLDDTNPLYSYMVLAQGKFNQDEDGLLTAREVLSLRLNANLVVLSSCDTGLGDVRSGEGLIGMTWSFFVAGVPSTVASQWSVETNSTTHLMVDFHENLTGDSKIKSPLGKADALRRAQIKLLDGDNYALPYYWAGFSLVGSPW